MLSLEMVDADTVSTPIKSGSLLAGNDENG